MKIVMLGNSVGLRIRPPSEYPNNKTYTQILRDEGHVTINLCKGRSLLQDITNNMDLILRECPDYYILNIGVTDLSSREIPLWYSDILHSKRSGIVRKINILIYEKFLKKIRRILVILRFKRSWVSEREYKDNLKYLIKRIKKETNAKIFIMPILSVTSRIEKELPGSKSRFEKINLWYESLNDNRVKVLTGIVREAGVVNPDGIHLNAEGHKEVASLILNEMGDWM
ncbi:MAG: SGNH/GDSL hydrolase family protein [Pseudomonadota bacterium]|nr:SGNH/GDSL hydrolase family protein [Pseudomonadota bacterium]